MKVSALPNPTTTRVPGYLGTLALPYSTLLPHFPTLPYTSLPYHSLLHPTQLLRYPTIPNTTNATLPTLYQRYPTYPTIRLVQVINALYWREAGSRSQSLTAASLSGVQSFAMSVPGYWGVQGAVRLCTPEYHWLCTQHPRYHFSTLVHGYPGCPGTWYRSQSLYQFWASLQC